MTNLRLRYTVDATTKTLAVDTPAGLQTLAAIALDATRGNPDAEGAWRECLGDAIEAAAAAASESS